MSGADIFGLIVLYYAVGLLICVWYDSIGDDDPSVWCFGEAFFWPVLVICLAVELVAGGFKHLLAHIGDIFDGKEKK